MKKSETIGALAKALASAQGEFEAVDKTSDNPFFKSKYANLPAVVLAASPILSKYGIAVSQLPDFDGVNDLLTTLVMHESGEWIEAEQRLHLVKSDPQGHGSAQTYGRRYAYSGGVGIVTEEDDDGNAASQPKAQTTVRREAPVRTSEALATRAAAHATTQAATLPGVDPNLISEKQIKLVAVLFGKKGFPDDRATRHAYVGSVIEREFASTKELSKKEASVLIDALNEMPDGGHPAEPYTAEEEQPF